MERRDFFKRVAGVIAAGVGAVLLPRSARGDVQCLGVQEVQPLMPVMGEQAHWPEEMSVRSHLRNGKIVRSRCVAARINGQWIDTSNWTPEQISLLPPNVLKQSG